MRRKRINPFWITLSVLLSAVTVVLCIFAWRGGTFRIEAQGDPQAVVSRFFNALVAGDYPGAYACLSDYSSLGLENASSVEEAAPLERALRDSYGFTLSGDAVVEGLSARQGVGLRVLDLQAVEAAVRQEVGPVTEELVEELPSEEIYDENMQYLPSFTDTIWSTALERVLAHAEDYRTDVPLELSLIYRSGEWRIQTSPALFNALLGNA